MLCVLKRTVSIRRFFRTPKHTFKLMVKKIFTILRTQNFLSGSMVLEPETTPSLPALIQFFRTTKSSINSSLPGLSARRLSDTGVSKKGIDKEVGISGTSIDVCLS